MKHIQFDDSIDDGNLNTADDMHLSNPELLHFLFFFLLNDFRQAFEEAFMSCKRPKAPEALKDHLCELYRDMAAQIKSIYGQAERK